MPDAKYYWKNRDKVKKANAKYYKLNRKKVLERNKAWAKANPESTYRKNRKWRDAHPEEVKSWQASSYKRNIKKRKKEQAKYRAAHKAETALRCAKNYLLNKDERKKNAALYQKKNPEKVKSYQATRRTRKTEAGGSFTASEWKSLCKQHHNKCLCCNRRRKLTADHVIPVSKGGTSNIRNIQPLCGPCNSSKGTKTTDYRKKRRVAIRKEKKQS